MTGPYAALRQCVEALERALSDDQRYLNECRAALTVARAALGAKQVTPMSQPNRKIAYAASDTLRKLGYQWDEAAEAWRLAAPPAPQTQRPVPLTDERMIEIFRASDFVLPTDEWVLEVARAVEAEVLRLNGIGDDDAKQ